MSSFALLMIPGTLFLLALLLFLSQWAETRVVSSRALILKVVNGRRTSPEVTERLVAEEVERILQRGV
jgi:hypothetical protein